MTDHEWQVHCEQAKVGDQLAYRALFDELEPRLYAYVRSRVFDTREAADVVQETLIAFFRALPQFIYTTTPQLYQYIFTIVRRQLIRVYEQQRHSTESFDETMGDGMVSDRHEAGLSQDIAAALATLDEVSREIIMLHHWARFTFKEIATLLTMEEGAVRTRHHRAKKLLGTKLA